MRRLENEGDPLKQRAKLMDGPPQSAELSCRYPMLDWKASVRASSIMSNLGNSLTQFNPER